MGLGIFGIKVCNPIVGTSNSTIMVVGSVNDLSHLVSNCESQRLSFYSFMVGVEMQSSWRKSTLKALYSLTNHASLSNVYTIALERCQCF